MREIERERQREIVSVESRGELGGAYKGGESQPGCGFIPSTLPETDDGV